MMKNRILRGIGAGLSGLALLVGSSNITFGDQIDDEIIRVKEQIVQKEDHLKTTQAGAFAGSVFLGGALDSLSASEINKEQATLNALQDRLTELLKLRYQKDNPTNVTVNLNNNMPTPQQQIYQPRQVEQPEEKLPRVFVCNEWIDYNSDNIADEREFLGRKDIFSDNEKMMIVFRDTKFKQAYDLQLKLFKGSKLFGENSYNVPSSENGMASKFHLRTGVMSPGEYTAAFFVNGTVVESTKVTVIPATGLEKTIQPSQQVSDWPEGDSFFACNSYFDENFNSFREFREYKRIKESFDFGESVILVAKIEGKEGKKVNLRMLNHKDEVIVNSDGAIPKNISVLQYPKNGSLSLDPGIYQALWAVEDSGVTKVIGINRFEVKAPDYTIATIRDLALEHDSLEVGVRGMAINPNVKIWNAQGRKIQFAAYFNNEDGTPLKGSDKQFETIDGKVSVGRDLTPNSAVFDFNDRLFMPYGQLEIREKGKHNLEFDLIVWDLTDANNPKRIGQLKDQKFTLTN